MNCDEARRAVQDALDAELSADAASALETHLKACPACRAAREGDRRLHERLPGLLACVPPERAPAFQEKVVEAIRMERSMDIRARDGQAWWERPWALGGLALAGAAAVALLILWKPAPKSARPGEASLAFAPASSPAARAAAPAPVGARTLGGTQTARAPKAPAKGAMAWRRARIRRTLTLVEARPSVGAPSIPGMGAGLSGSSGKAPPLPMPSGIKRKDFAWAEAVIKETADGKRAAFRGMSGTYGRGGAGSKGRSSVKAAAGGMPSGSAMLGRIVNAWMQEFSRSPERLDLEDVFGLLRPVSMSRDAALEFIRELDGSLLDSLFRRMDAPQETRYLPEVLKDREVLTAFLGKLNSDSAAKLRRAVPEIASIAGAPQAPAEPAPAEAWTDDDLAQARADAVAYQRTLEQDLLRPMVEHAKSLLSLAEPRTREGAEGLRTILFSSGDDIRWLEQRFPQSRVLADLKGIRSEYAGRSSSDTLLGRLDADAASLSAGARLLSTDDLDAWTRLGLAAQAVASRELKAREAAHYADEYRASYEADRERLEAREREALAEYLARLDRSRESLETSAWQLWGEEGQQRARELGQASALVHEALDRWLIGYNRSYERPEEAYRAWALPACLRRRFGEVAAEAVLRESEAAAEFSAMGRDGLSDDQRAEHFLLGVRSQIQSLWCVRGAVMYLGARTCEEGGQIESAQNEFTAGLAGFQ